MPFQNIQSQRLYRQVASQIASLIEAGEYKFGERLPAERDLCTRLGVSRPSLREALIALEMEKVVEVRSGSGIFVLGRPIPGDHTVASGSPLGPFDVIRARSHLETEIAVLAVKNATPLQIQRVKESLDELRTCAVGKPGLIESDRQFHLCIAEASGNSAYVLLLETLWQHRTAPIYYQLENHFLSNTVWQKSMSEHEAIYASLAARDAVAASVAMQTHMQNAENRMASKLD